MIPIGLYLNLMAVGSTNDAESMAGGLMMIIYPFLLGIGIPILYYGTVLVRIPSGGVYLFLALISGGWVFGNVWFYPIDSVTYYKSRYGFVMADSLFFPDSWQHVVAFTCVTVFLYWGLTGTFKRTFSFAPRSTQGAILYRSAVILLATGLFLALGYLYNLFAGNIIFLEGLIAGSMTVSRDDIIVTISFLAPICCLFVGFTVKRYEKIALVLFLAGSAMLLLVTVTFLAYKLF